MRLCCKPWSSRLEAVSGQVLGRAAHPSHTSLGHQSGLHGLEPTMTQAAMTTRSPLKTPQVVVVGAGMAGLVSALLLANAGAQVTVLEAGEQVGGKIRQLWPGAERQSPQSPQ